MGYLYRCFALSDRIYITRCSGGCSGNRHYWAVHRAGTMSTVVQRHYWAVHRAVTMSTVVHRAGTMSTVVQRHYWAVHRAGTMSTVVHRAGTMSTVVAFTKLKPCLNDRKRVRNQWESNNN
eukprot:TRINITY_DN30392_c0_g1_i1.p1 TRINITY_DN30392_c0_g1~~TRINITY_DN30392_c0_g1_i1.p1  ORF type:complete len:121 (+),score=7.70 TRINITY_DN30392_c0_g1_i1:103-465(+)